MLPTRAIDILSYLLMLAIYSLLCKFVILVLAFVLIKSNVVV